MRATEHLSPREPPPEQGLAARIAFLSEPSSYPAGTRRVEAIETHLSWVFLTERHAYKLKKPQRFDHYDLGSVEARHRHCEMEVRLNRRLSDDVYLGTVPLTRDADGDLRLDECGEAVDWLVWMRRLPRELMLDVMIRDRAVRHRDVRVLVERLARFYRTCAPAAVSEDEFRARLAARVAQNMRELSSFGAPLPADPVRDLAARQLAFLAREARLFDARVADGYVVEAHGDLRPEHVCLETPPQIIDCLEFSRELRTLDAAEELGFLALECERLGAPQLKQDLFDAYAQAAGDEPAPRLVSFYQSHHACVRARLAIAHLRDAAVREPQRWARRAREYLELAQNHLDRCAMPKL